MTAPPIPIQSVNINPQFVPNQGNPGLELLMRALQQRREIELRKKKLAQDQEQFELNKRIAGSQIEGQDLINAERKAKLKKEEEDTAAQDQAHQIFVGNLTRANDMAGWGEVIVGVKDRAVGRHLMDYIKDYFTTEAARPAQSLVASPSPDSPTGYGYTAIDPRNPAGGGTPTGVAAPSPREPVRRESVPIERKSASGFVNAAMANAIINRLEERDPTIAARVARKVALRKSFISGILRRAAGTSQEDANYQAEQQIEQSMTPDELEFYASAKQFLAPVLSVESGKQVTGREYMIHAPVFFSMGGVTPQVTKNRRGARASKLRGFYAESGEAGPPRLQELIDAGIDLSEYGIGTAPTQRKRRPENPY
jgi:hypothetical protein